MTKAPQYIRNAVADFICPIDSIANYQQGYPRFEAEEIRAGRGDDHELMRLVMGCVDADSFQSRVQPWMLECFGAEIAADRIERNHRFLEEALELVQACGCTASEAHQLVDYTFGRPVGERHQEVGGVMNTLAALCLAYDLDMAEEGDREIARCWEKMDRIRAKQATKPKHSPLPSSPPEPAAPELGGDDPLAMVVDRRRRRRAWRLAR